MIVIIIYAGKDGMVAVFAEFKHTPTEAHRGAEIDRVCENEGFSSLRAQFLKARHHTPYWWTHLGQEDLVTMAKF